MASVDQVGALPGGGAFAAIWEQVDGSAGAVDDAAAALSKVGEGISSAQRGLGASAAGVEDGWRGSAAAAFGSYLGKVGSAAANVEQIMQKSASELRSAAAAIDEAKDGVERIASQIMDDVTRIEQLDASQSPTVNIPALIEAAVSKGCQQARPIADALSGRLSDIAQILTTAGNVGGYASLKEPGTYLPPPGGHIDWSAVPKAGEHGSTRPASAGGGASSGGGSAGSSAGSSGGPPAAQPTGNVKTWIDEAIQLLEQHGYNASQLNAADINLIIQHESSGNPHAENLTDSNAAAGHPSKGLMQCIDSTFNGYALPGHQDIWNPVDNIVAGVRYAISRYGSIDNVPGVRAVHSGGSYVGY